LLKFDIAMLNILSFDCAIKQLGVCYVKSNINIVGDISHELKRVKDDNDAIVANDNITKLIDESNQIMWLDNVDLTPGKKVGVVNQLGLGEALCNELEIIDNKSTGCNIVLIECQPAKINNRSSVICGQLICHYINRRNRGLCDEVHVVPATWKNKISMSKDLDLTAFKKRNYASNYTCNKAHSRENFRHWASVFGYDLKKINRPITDIADAFMQAMAWVARNQRSPQP